ncbi:MAG TPA: CDP-diacylglycerol diphosphatase [Acetobacteraceae bacterium]|nr:CDP-diacylglycerol diphosphatase [Acetobacteraceae bacterium]
MRTFPAVFALAIALFPALARADANALWRIISEQCVPHQADYAWPSPCLAVRQDEGYVVLKDRVGATQLLVMPTARITGIEDPAILSPQAPNYFQFAWQTINIVRALADSALPDDALSLAVNSIFGRTQNQLHIHVDCLQPEVRQALLAHAAEVSPAWAPFPVPLAGKPYLARSVDTLNRPGETPFELVAAGLPDARSHMDRMTILVAARPASLGPGFLIFAGQASPPSNLGSAEELQDHTCALARKP